MWRPRSSADSSTCRSATRSSELAREDGHPQCIRGGRPISRSDRERNPDPEEVEAPLVVTGIPHRLLLEAPVVDWRRRRSPRLRQRSIPRWRRRCAPAPGRQIITPRGTVESTAPVVVPGVPWWSPVVVVGSAEVTGRRTAGSAGSAGSAEVTRSESGPPGPPGPRKSPGADRPDRRVRRVRGSHPVEDRPARPVAVARRGRAAVARRVRAAAVARPDRLGRIEPVETACTEVRRRQCLTPD